MQTVYRVQNSYGKGPYTLGLYWTDESHSISTGRPAPKDDELGDELFNLKSKYGEHNILFGFTSLEKLKNWFSKNELEKLKNLKFYIEKLISDIVIEGKTETQCIFVKLEE